MSVAVSDSLQRRWSEHTSELPLAILGSALDARSPLAASAPLVRRAHLEGAAEPLSTISAHGSRSLCQRPDIERAIDRMIERAVPVWPQGIAGARPGHHVLAVFLRSHTARPAVATLSFNMSYEVMHLL